MLDKKHIFLLTFMTMMIIVSVLIGSQNAQATTYCHATGGTITTSGGNTIHTFTSNGTFQITSGSCNLNVLVVGGD